MDQELKQRLVGVAVITSLGAIFIPMLFDDPVDESGKMISELTLPKAPLTPLNNNTKSLQKTIEEIVNLPPPEPIKQAQIKPLHSLGLERWFLQVGTFSQKENAITLRDKIRIQGFPVTITKISNETGPMYKVMVGPELDKKRGESMKLKLDKLNDINSILTSEK